MTYTWVLRATQSMFTKPSPDPCKAGLVSIIKWDQPNKISKSYWLSRRAYHVFPLLGSREKDLAFSQNCAIWVCSWKLLLKNAQISL